MISLQISSGTELFECFTDIRQKSFRQKNKFLQNFLIENC